MSRLILLALLLLSSPLTPSTAQTAGDKTEGRILKVGGDWGYPPFEYLDEAGKPAGFNVELISMIARAVGLTIEIDLSPWNEAKERLERGEVDLLPGMYRSPEREGLVDFSLPHFITVYRIFAPKNSGIKGLDDIRGLRVATQRGDLGHEYLLAEGLGDRLVFVEDWKDLFGTLTRGEADCAVSSTLQGLKATGDRAFASIEAVGAPLFAAEYCIAVREGDAELLAKVNEGLGIVRATGDYDRLYRRWFGDSGEAGGTGAGIMAAIVAAAVTIVAAALLWAAAARSGIRRARGELEAEARRRSEAQARLREALAAADAARLEAERAGRDRSAFASWVSRELRTPMQGIAGAVELLGKTALDDDQARTLAMARVSAEGLTRVISDLIDAIGAEKGSLRLAAEEFSFEDFSARTEAAIRPLAEERGLAFRFSSSGGSRRVVADERRIGQVIAKLCSNAVKYTDRGEVELTLGLHDDSLYVSVRDTGPGIPEEAKDRLFQPYYRAAGADRNSAGGLGLGLAIVKTIVDAMGGSIRYETHPSLGTHFEVSVPVRGAAATMRSTADEPGNPAPAPVARPDVGAARRRGRAIIAEDEAINRLYLKRVLETAGYEVMQAVDGEAALGAAASGVWDFILMDVSMPRMDGLEATRRIRALEAEKGAPRVPIVALTAHAYAEDREACAQAGMDGFLSKPFTEPALWAEVRRVAAP